MQPPRHCRLDLVQLRLNTGGRGCRVLLLGSRSSGLGARSSEFGEGGVKTLADDLSVCVSLREFGDWVTVKALARSGVRDGYSQLNVALIEGRHDEPIAAEGLGHSVIGHDVCSEIRQELKAALMRRWIAGDRVMVGGDHQEPNALGEDLTSSLEKGQLGTLHIEEQEIEAGQAEARQE